MTDSTNAAETESTTDGGVYLDEIKGNGYVRITDTVADELCYEHQLNACLENDPYEVFDPSTQVHHRNKQAVDNRPENIDVVSNYHHRLIHKRGEWSEDGGEPVWDIASSDVTSFD